MSLAKENIFNQTFGGRLNQAIKVYEKQREPKEVHHIFRSEYIEYNII